MRKTKIPREVRIAGNELIPAIGEYIQKRDSVKPSVMVATGNAAKSLVKDDKGVDDPKPMTQLIPYPLAPGVKCCLTNRLTYTVSFKVFDNLESMNVEESYYTLTWDELKPILEKLSGVKFPTPAIAYEAESQPLNANNTFTYRKYEEGRWEGTGHLAFIWTEEKFVPDGSDGISDFEPTKEDAPKPAVQPLKGNAAKDGDK